MKYPFVFYANWPVPKRFAGTTYGPICFIRPKYLRDDGLRAHESLHAIDWWSYGLNGVAMVALLDWLVNGSVGTSALPYVFAMCLYSFLYLLVPDFKLWAESRCYARQALYYADDRRPLFASFISSNYGLNVTNADALAAIREAAL